MSNPDYREIEVKMQVPDLDIVQAKLKQVGAALQSERVYERNIRYDNVNGSFAGQGFVLRLRQDNAVRLTYKEPADTEAAARGLQQRTEMEVTVSDFDTMHLILERIGFAPYMIYEKYRTTYRINEAEIVLDEMPYGSFVEIEAPDEATIDRTAEKLNLSDVPRLSASYSRLFEYVKAHLGLTFTDLTFSNFKGIVVPPEAFTAPPIS